MKTGYPVYLNILFDLHRKSWFTSFPESKSLMTFNPPTTARFAGSFFRRLSRIACSSLMLLALAAPLPAADILYVTLNNNTIVSYDTTGNVGETILATKSTFASTNLNNPRGLAFDTSGNLYAGNWTNPGTISKFNSSGVYQSNITSNLSYVAALAFDSSGNLYAVNRGGNTISKFNSSGNYLSNITTNMNVPYGLAIYSGNLYVANAGDSTISKFDSSGVYISNITTNLGSPYGLAFDSSGNLYAANNSSNTISKFDSSGAYVNIGSIGSTNLSGPSGLAFDSSGNLYASNGTSKTISKFDSSGTFLTSWSTGTATPQLLAFKPVTVPEPSTYALAAIATGVMAYLARRRKACTA
jgi:DNA-binding beta-propeller fold protein YncE